MNIEQQVTSFELSNKLKKLGVKQESLFYWHSVSEAKTHWYLGTVDVFGDGISAFTISELLELFPKKHWWGIRKSQRENIYECYSPFYEKEEFDESATNSCAKRYIDLIENKLLDLNQ